MMIYIILIIGLALLLAGANYLVESSVAIAQKAKISDFVIGITIVGLGTSSPELFISLSSALAGSGDIAIGNVVGSTICNTLLILGVTAVIRPFAIERVTLRFDIPVGLIATLLLTLLCLDTFVWGAGTNMLSRIDGIILLAVFISYIIYVFVRSSKDKKHETENEEKSTSSMSHKSVWLLIPVALLSLGALLYGGELFLDSAVTLASQWGMSDSVISITLVAIGTSLPELVTCIIAASKGNAQLALGNVIGSNIFNIFMILGLTSIISPITLVGVNIVDLSVMIISFILIFVAAFTLRRSVIDRSEGVVFVLIYIAYTAYLLLK